VLANINTTLIRRNLRIESPWLNSPTLIDAKKATLPFAVPNPAVINPLREAAHFNRFSFLRRKIVRQISVKSGELSLLSIGHRLVGPMFGKTGQKTGNQVVETLGPLPFLGFIVVDGLYDYPAFLMIICEPRSMLLAGVDE
jgi:hypothetical protein